MTEGGLINGNFTKANANNENTSLLDSSSTDTSSEFALVLKSSIPLIITFLLQYSITVTTIFSVGRLGKTELASVSLAAITFNVSVAIFNGMATCLDTFCAQAYGSKNYILVGILFQRCSALILVFSIPIVFFWCYCATFLSFIVPEHNLLILAQRYLRFMSFGTPGYILFETGKRFLQAQGIYHAGQYCLMIVTPVNIFLNYFLVWRCDSSFGYIGGPISAAISYWLMCILLMLYVIFIDGRKCWGGFNIQESLNLKEWASMVLYALNGTAMLLSEFVAFEILTLSASRFGTASLAAQSICSTLATLAFQVPFGVSVALSTRIGFHLGSENLRALALMNKVAYMLSIILGLLSSGVLLIFHEKICRIFTSDGNVVNIASLIVKILGINQLYDCPNVILAGALRGQGRQHIGSVLNLIAYYIFAVPVALVLSFVFHMTLQGLWIGIGVGVFILALCELYFIVTSDWGSIVRDAKDRVE